MVLEVVVAVADMFVVEWTLARSMSMVVLMPLLQRWSLLAVVMAGCSRKRREKKKKAAAAMIAADWRTSDEQVACSFRAQCFHFHVRLVKPTKNAVVVVDEK